jgi:CRP-like cAMP-binding protein
VVTTRGPGSPLGQIAPIADPPRRATLRARTPVAALVADQRSFTRILGGVPQLQDRIEALVEQQRVA